MNMREKIEKAIRDNVMEDHGSVGGIDGAADAVLDVLMQPSDAVLYKMEKAMAPYGTMPSEYCLKAVKAMIRAIKEGK